MSRSLVYFTNNEFRSSVHTRVGHQLLPLGPSSGGGLPSYQTGATIIEGTERVPGEETTITTGNTFNTAAASITLISPTCGCGIISQQYRAPNWASKHEAIDGIGSVG